MREEFSNERTKVLGLEYKVAAALCYTPILLLSVVAPIVILKTEPKENKRLRFHAIQGMALSLAALALGVANSMLTSLLFSLFGFGAWQIFGSLSSLISLAVIGVFVYCIYSVCTNKDLRLPYVSEIADRNA